MTLTPMTSAFFVRSQYTTVKTNDDPLLPWESPARALGDAAMVISFYMLALSNLRFILQARDISNFSCTGTLAVEPCFGKAAIRINTGVASCLVR